MIKPVLKYCIPIYLLLGLATIIVLRRSSPSLAAVLLLLFMIICVIVLGLLIGMIISVLIRRPHRERIFYTIGQLISFVLLASTFIQAIPANNHPKRSIAEENEVTVREVTDSSIWPFVLPAFDSLKLKFKNPNDIEINSVTALQNSRGFTLYFVYNLSGDKSEEYYSKYQAHKGQADLIQFNLNTRATRGGMRLQKQQKAIDDSVNKYEKMTK